METATKAREKKSTPTAERYGRSIDLLNDAVGKEIATSLQYMYFHSHFEDARYRYLSRIMRETSITEMQHIEELADRILYLEGDVDMNPQFRTRQITEPAEALQFAMELERNTIDKYNEASRIASECGDAVTHKMFQNLIVEEERHLDTFRTELQNLKDYGDEYLALQSVAGSRQAAKELNRNRHKHEHED